jgi:hypothetical protein
LFELQPASFPLVLSHPVAKRLNLNVLFLANISNIAIGRNKSAGIWPRGEEL